MAKTPFKISRDYDLKLELFNVDGDLITVIYDSGFRNLKQCHDALLRKAVNPPRNTRFRVTKLEVVSPAIVWTNL